MTKRRWDFGMGYVQLPELVKPKKLHLVSLCLTFADGTWMLHFIVLNRFVSLGWVDFNG